MRNVVAYVYTVQPKGLTFQKAFWQKTAQPPKQGWDGHRAHALPTSCKNTSMWVKDQVHKESLFMTAHSVNSDVIVRGWTVMVASLLNVA